MSSLLKMVILSFFVLSGSGVNLQFYINDERLRFHCLKNFL